LKANLPVQKTFHRTWREVSEKLNKDPRPAGGLSSGRTMVTAFGQWRMENGNAPRPQPVEIKPN